MYPDAARTLGHSAYYVNFGAIALPEAVNIVASKGLTRSVQGAIMSISIPATPLYNAHLGGLFVYGCLSKATS